MLVLSLFPGIGLMDMAFEQEGFCVVRGPDLLWGGDIHRFHPPAGRFDGIIGGPPCQRFSVLANIVKAVHGEQALAPDLTPEYERCVAEAQPAWFLMENVPRAPEPVVPGYIARSCLLNARLFGSSQNRERRFSFGSRTGIELSAKSIARSIRAIAGTWEPAVCSGAREVPIAINGSGRRKRFYDRTTSGHGPLRSLGDMLRLQGVDPHMLDAMPFTMTAKRCIVANGVPLPLGCAVARAVLEAIQNMNSHVRSNDPSR